MMPTTDLTTLGGATQTAPLGSMQSQGQGIIASIQPARTSTSVPPSFLNYEYITIIPRHCLCGLCRLLDNGDEKELMSGSRTPEEVRKDFKKIYAKIDEIKALLKGKKNEKDTGKDAGLQRPD